MVKTHDCFMNSKRHKNSLRNIKDGQAKLFFQRSFTVQILESYEETEFLLIMGQDVRKMGLNPQSTGFRYGEEQLGAEFLLLQVKIFISLASLTLNPAGSPWTYVHCRSEECSSHFFSVLSQGFYNVLQLTFLKLSRGIRQNMGIQVRGYFSTSITLYLESVFLFLAELNLSKTCMLNL